MPGMFIYLSKKIAIPHNLRLQCVSWNSEQGWISCGGANGLLKVLKLEEKKKKGAKKNPNQAAAAPADLSMNQTLEGHNGTVMVVTWNENYRKLTTSDQYGLIIVWMLHKGMWFEEMINNRNRSVVRDMKWTADGQKICIVYEDGAVIVGSVDGNRLWGKDLEGVELAFVEWSPDGRNILFGTTAGEVLAYDNQGTFISKLPIFAVTPGTGTRIVGLQWYNGMQGYVEPGVPTLAICFENGRVQIMRDDTDDNPVLIDTMISASKMKWNSMGSVLAIAGTRSAGEGKDTQMVQFYTPFGKHLRTLKVPGSGITSLSWEGGSLRLALAVDSFIYFANIRPDYEWGYFANTLVYAFNKPDRPENCVCFWDTSSDERHIKYVRQLLAIRAAGDNCVFATKAERERDDQPESWILILCNAIGSPVDSKSILIEPMHISMTPYHVIVASNDHIYVWQYRSPVAKLTSVSKADTVAAARRKEGRERLFHIDDPSASALPISPAMTSMTDSKALSFLKLATPDPVCCVTATQTTLLVGRASGTLMKYSLPHLTFEQRYQVRCRPQILALNCDSTRVSVIDINGVLILFDLEAKPEGPKGTPGKQLDFERKDAWDMKWSDDNPELFACMEKTRMYVFRGLHAEEPVLSNGYLCSFNDLCIKAVLMDDVIADPEHPDKECIVNFETKSLRDTRELLASVPISEAYQFVEDNPHPRLWRILAEAALEQLNFLTADKAFVRCSDYQGIQFVKRLQLLPNRDRQKAEVAAYFRRFEEAETIFINTDCKDLAVELRTRLGDWFRVVQLVSGGNSGDDKLLSTAYNNIGDYYADRQKWVKAQKYYLKAKNLKELVNCAYVLDDYDQLRGLIDQIPEGSDLLRNVGDKFMSVGLCNEAVIAFLKAGDAKAAIDCCVLLNQWDQAVELAEQHSHTQIEGLLTRYASHLLIKNKLFQAVELYRKANRHTDAAKLLAQLGEQAGRTKVDPLRAKKLYVLAALEVDRYKRKMLDAQVGGPGMGHGTTMATTAATLSSLMEHDAVTGSDRGLENPWHGAEAYHFFLLAQRQLQAGKLELALRTSLRLADYEDILDVKDIYSIISYASYLTKYYGQCSRAFIKLESVDTLTSEEREKFKKMALGIFVRNAPNDPPSREYPCPNRKCEAQVKDIWTHCADCGKHLPACIVTGRSLLNEEVWTCRVCKHRASEREIGLFTCCPLCHTPLDTRYGSGNPLEKLRHTDEIVRSATSALK